jgi:hypothetical protein
MYVQFVSQKLSPSIFLDVYSQLMLDTIFNLQQKQTCFCFAENPA